MSTNVATAGTATLGTYFVEDGPSIRHLKQVKGQGRNKGLTLRDKTVVFSLTNKSDNTKSVVRMVVTEIDSDVNDGVHITGYDVGSSRGKVTIQYDPATRKGELEIEGRGPLVSAVGRHR